MKKLWLLLILALYSCLCTAQVNDTLSVPALYLRMEAIRRLPPDVKKAVRVADLSKHIQFSPIEYAELLEESLRIAADHGRTDLLATLNEAKSRTKGGEKSPVQVPSFSEGEQSLNRRPYPAKEVWAIHDPKALRAAYQEAVRATTGSGDRELLQAIKVTYADHLVHYGSKNEGIHIFRNLVTEVSLSEKDRIHVLSQLVIHLFKLNDTSAANAYYAHLQQASAEGVEPEEEEEWALATGLYHEYGRRHLLAKSAYWQVVGNRGTLSLASLEAALRLAAGYSRTLQRDSAEVYFNRVRSGFQSLPSYLQYEYSAAYREHRQRFRKVPLVADWTEVLRLQDSQYREELVRITRELSLQNQVLESNRKVRQAEQQQQINALKHAGIQQRLTVTALVLSLVILVAVGLAYGFFLRRRQAALLHQKEVERLQEKHRHDVLRELSGAQESERGRIAGKLHDEIGSMLSVARLNLSSLKDGSAGDQAKLETADKLLGAIAVTIREMSHQLMPVAIREYGLKQAIRQLIADINAAGKVWVEEVIVGLDGEDEYPEEICIGLYRIVQEALQNTVKHSGADKAIVQIVEHDDMVSLMVEDNGKGVSPEDGKKGKGLQLLRSRVDYLQGKMMMEKGSEGGLLLSVELPLIKIVP